MTTKTTNDYKVLRQYCHCNTDTESKQIFPCSGDGRPAPLRASNHFGPDCNMQNNKSYNTTIQRAMLTLSVCVHGYNGNCQMFC